MALPPVLKGATSEPGVGGGVPVVLPPNLGHVHHAGCGAVAGDGALRLVSTVAEGSGVLGFWSEDIFVLPGDLVSHVGETAVTDLHGISVANFKQGMLLMKCRLDNFEKLLADICFNIATPRWIEVDSFPFSYSFLLLV